MIRVIGQEVCPPRRWLSERRQAWCAVIALGLVLPGCRGDRLQGADWVAPVALALSGDGRTLHVAGARSRQVLTLDLSTAQVVRTVPLDEEPTGLALSTDGARLAVTCSGQTNAVLLLDPLTGQVKRRLPAGVGVCSPVFNQSGTTLYVCLRFENAVAAIDLTTGRERARLHTRREPIAAALTPDERLLVVANHLPDGPANTRIVATALTVVDTASFTIRTNLMLPNGSVAVRGVAISPSGKLATVTHNVARFQVPTTQVEHGWMNDSALSLIDLETLTLKHTLLLDEPTRGAANPWAVAWTPDERWLCVAHSGTHELSVIGVPALFEKLADATPGRLIDNLTFLQGVRKRVPLIGNGPRAMAVEGTKVWVAGFFSDSVESVALASGAAARSVRPGDPDGRGEEVHATDAGSQSQLSRDKAEGTADHANHADGGNDGAARGQARLGLGAASPDRDPPRTGARGPVPRPFAYSAYSAVSPAESTPLSAPAVPDSQRLGEQLFHDATIGHQSWQSCASCHPDGRADALNWDLLNDGIGNPKNTKSLLWSHRTPPAMSHGVRGTAEKAVRSGLRNILFALRPEDEAAAIDEYLKALRPVPSPYLVGGKLSEAARRGQRLFEDPKVGCATCHPGALFTDLKAHAVGTANRQDRLGQKFDTPTLVECWRTVPYLHDGSAVTFEEVLTTRNPKDEHGRTSHLTPIEIQDLGAYVRSL
jgi:DNA-binding beta-propeller fold protein YncE